PLLLPRFKAVRITTNEQLIHVSRYIHLNLYSSGIVEDFETLVQYEWSSFKDYVQKGAGYLGLVDGRRVLALFDKDSERYKNFVLSNAEHQRTLEHTKHTRAWR
ncbi:hypothetical protein L6258_01260, partial [Candidatus Parcubacteria bacterium]|nr:hypothetical protein [Candidatus Parcubacteria bacterium]